MYKRFQLRNKLVSLQFLFQFMYSRTTTFTFFILRINLLVIGVLIGMFKTVNGQKLYSESDVDKNIKAAGENWTELVKAIKYFKKDKDPLKQEAVNFLIANMDIHFSADYVWVNSKGKEIKIDELSFSDFNSFKKSIDKMKDQGKIDETKEVQIMDLNSVNAKTLINTVNHAFKAWKNSNYRNISFNNFCEYILPYRVTIEPIQYWQPTYVSKYKWIGDSLNINPIEKVLPYVAADHKSLWINTYNAGGREEPLPRLGAQQLLFRMSGACEDIAALQVFMLRSQGIPASFNYIPYWATSTGGHFLNSVFNEEMQPLKYDATSTPAIVDLTREPGKVLRITYSKQKNMLADLEHLDSIPPGFMQTRNYIDITDEYWKTQSVTCLINKLKPNCLIVYACVYNGGAWQPTWWGKVNNSTVEFSKMAKGAVYLPAYFSNGEIVPAGYPKGLGYSGEVELKPDQENKNTIVIQEQDRYLKFRADKSYSLYYWDDEWKLIAEKKATSETRELTFDDVPSNALLILIPEYSQGKERPFMIKDGKRYWW